MPRPGRRASSTGQGAMVERLRPWPWRGQGHRAGALWRDPWRLGRRLPGRARSTRPSPGSPRPELLWA
jgi:hypothetical protein